MATQDLGRNVSAQYPEGVARQALGFLSGQHARFDRFLESSGVPYVAFKNPTIGQELALAILDYLVADEEALHEFSECAAIPPEAAYEARRAFASGKARRAFGSRPPQ